MATDGGGFTGIGVAVRDIQSRLTASRGQDLEPRSSDNAMEAAQKFEAYLAQVMLREMRKTLPEGGIFSGPPMDSFVDMFDQAVADRIAEGGRLGLADQLARSFGDGVADLGGALSGLPPVEVARRGRNIPLHPFQHQGPEQPQREQLRRGVWPVAGAVSSSFGHRADPFNGKLRHHAGLDIAAPTGTPIRAVEGGEVVLSGQRRGYGNVVMVRHDDGTTGLYAHCRDLHVSKGARVQAGQDIATVGSTGRATGPHLHFELRTESGAVDPQALYEWAGR
jgi:murein DD-endopeptidase MepM/ murein hydrolase activator NlpD